jgi:hypothetical protein
LPDSREGGLAGLATKIITLTVCDHCPPGRKLPATTTVRISWDGKPPEEHDLCDEAADKIHAILYAQPLTALVDTELPPVEEEEAKEEPFASPFGDVEDRRRAAEQRARQWAADRAAAAPKAEPKPAPEVALMPVAAFGWTLTEHARRRALVRGFDIREVLTAAANPEQSYVQPAHGEHAAIHQRGEVAVAVNKKDRVVISVLHRVQENYDPSAHRSQVRSTRAR